LNKLCHVRFCHPPGSSGFESDIGGKWLDVLKEVAPRVTRAAVLLHPKTTANVAYLRAAEAAAPSLDVTLTAAGVHDVM
jgi:putative ABC transport system substrate-binding protein